MDFNFFNQLIIMLSLSVVLVAVFKRLELPEILGYICVGVLLGPMTLNIVGNSGEITLLAEIGVVFLLFTLGLNFSIRTIKKMKKEVFNLGGLQVFLSTLGIFFALLLLKFQQLESLVVAGALALSSTVIVIRELTQRNEVQSRHGQLAVGTLLFQDIAAVVFLIFLPVFADSTQNSSILFTFALTFLKGGCFVFAMLGAGKWFLPVLFDEVAKAKSQELFVLTALITALMAAWLAHFLGLSMALGGFVAGMMLGESTYKHQLEADIRPFRDVLLGLFFISIGLMLEPDILTKAWPIIIAGTILLIFWKFFVVYVLTRIINETKKTAIKTAVFLSQGGEFCFALLSIAAAYGQIDSYLASIVLSITIISMLVAPFLIRRSYWLVHLLVGKHKTDSPEYIDNEEIRKQTAHIKKHMLICGYGRVGQTISRFFSKEGEGFVAVDYDSLHVHEARLAKEPVFYGDCRRYEILEAVGIKRAALVIVCVDHLNTSQIIVQKIRERHHNLPIVVRTRREDSVDILLHFGATLVVPEVLEASLLIAQHALILLGMSETHVRKRIAAVRKERYVTLRGYYPGMFDDKEDDAKRELRHAITILETSSVNGKKIKKIPIDECGVKVLEIIRGDKALEVKGNLVLRGGDVVVVKGSAINLKRMERQLR